VAQGGGGAQCYCGWNIPLERSERKWSKVVEHNVIVDGISPWREVKGSGPRWWTTMLLWMGKQLNIEQTNENKNNKLNMRQTNKTTNKEASLRRKARRGGVCV
jgi:hypothetical protein